MNDSLRLALAVAVALALTSASATAQVAQEDEAPYSEVHAFDREWGIALYGTGHVGSYNAGGIGGRLRWAPFEADVPLELEVYFEGTIVDWDGEGFRHDYPNGLNLVFPVRVHQDLRVRPYLGFCDILSFVEPSQDDAPRADDVLIGVHGGLGLEWAVHPMLSLFVDGQANFYMGHDRASAGWTGGVDEDFAFFWNGQLNLGVQFHVGR